MGMELTSFGRCVVVLLVWSLAALVTFVLGGPLGVQTMTYPDALVMTWPSLFLAFGL